MSTEKPRPKKVIDTESYKNIERTYANLSQALYQAGNESSLIMYNIQENARFGVIRVVNIKRRMKKNQEVIKDCMYGADYTINTVQDLQGISTFKRLSGMTKNLCHSLRKYQDPSYEPPKEKEEGKEEAITITKEEVNTPIIQEKKEGKEEITETIETTPAEVSTSTPQEEKKEKEVIQTTPAGASTPKPQEFTEEQQRSESPAQASEVMAPEAIKPEAGERSDITKGADERLSLSPSIQESTTPNSQEPTTPDLQDDENEKKPEGDDAFDFEEFVPIKKKTPKGKGKAKKKGMNKKNAHSQHQQQHEVEDNSSMDFDLKPKQF